MPSEPSRGKNFQNISGGKGWHEADAFPAIFISARER
jgi:hypothetical protein